MNVLLIDDWTIGLMKKWMNRLVDTEYMNKWISGWMDGCIVIYKTNVLVIFLRSKWRNQKIRESFKVLKTFRLIA